MVKIVCPNSDYTGVSATVQFVNGVGETANPYLIAWFKANGYAVEDAETPKRKQKATASEEVSEGDRASIS